MDTKVYGMLLSTNFPSKPTLVATLFIYFLKDLISYQMLAGMGELVRVGFLSKLKSEEL